MVKCVTIITISVVCYACRQDGGKLAGVSVTKFARGIYSARRYIFVVFDKIKIISQILVYSIPCVGLLVICNASNSYTV